MAVRPPRITEEDLKNLIKCCEDTTLQLNELKDKLAKIIEFKRKSTSTEGDSGIASGSVMFRQVKGVLDTIANLEKINKTVPESIQEVKELSNQAKILLGQKHDAVARSGLGLGFGVGESESGGEQEDE